MFIQLATMMFKRHFQEKSATEQELFFFCWFMKEVGKPAEALELLNGSALGGRGREREGEGEGGRERKGGRESEGGGDGGRESEGEREEGEGGRRKEMEAEGGIGREREREKEFWSLIFFPRRHGQESGEDRVPEIGKNCGAS
jgi:hypothetical protein